MILSPKVKDLHIVAVRVLLKAPLSTLGARSLSRAIAYVKINKILNEETKIHLFLDPSSETFINIYTLIFAADLSLFGLKSSND